MSREPNDLPRIYKRSGKSDDPFVPISASYPIINGRITLGEIPDRFTGVQIAGYNEIQPNLQNATLHISDNEFLVDYENGTCYFNLSQEGKQVSSFFMGTGYMELPASRIYAHVTGVPNVVDNLQNIVNRSLQTLGNAEHMIDDAEETIERLNNVANMSLRIPKPYVQTFDDLAVTYPDPETGWTVLTVDTGITYRWSGASWVGIETLDTYPYQASRQRVIPFIIANTVRTGIDGKAISLPFHGEIIDAKAYLVQSGASATVIRIEKCSQTNFISNTGWTNIFSKNLRIDANQKSSTTSSQPHEIAIAEVDEHDYFRLVIPSTSGDAKGLTVQLTIRV